MAFYEFQKRFPDSDACLEYLMHVRYGGTEIDCPKCGEFSKFYRKKRDPAYLCQHCKHHIFPCAGTFLHRTHLPLHKWFYAMFLFAVSRNGVSAKELERALDVSYPTAWRMGHKIREHMIDVDPDYPLGGFYETVEIDETLVGGKVKGKGRAYRGNKTVVMRMAERGGDIKTQVVPDVKRKTLEPIIRLDVVEGTRVHTDELGSYQSLDSLGYRHEAVNHSAGECVRDDCHVNSVEGFWSRLKNSIRETHVHVSRKHLQNYAAELQYRYNRRKRPARIFEDLVQKF